MLPDRLVAPPKGLFTLGSDPTRFQTEPPACHRASWQLPGRDSHPLTTTSSCQITIYTYRPPTLGTPAGVTNAAGEVVGRFYDEASRAPTPVLLRPTTAR
jgi:hypothetical protein